MQQMKGYLKSFGSLSAKYFLILIVHWTPVHIGIEKSIRMSE